MHSLPHIDSVMPPRLARAVCLQARALAVLAVIAGRPWTRKDPEPAPVSPPPPRQERRIRVVQLPKPQPVQQVEREVPEHAEHPEVPEPPRPPMPSPLKP